MDIWMNDRRLCVPAPQGQQGYIISPSALANKHSFCMPVVRAAVACQ